jgi:hypothetical protein
VIDRAAATWIADGNTSFDDWLALTWSFGCTTGSPPRRSVARLASTSFMFMFVDVPEPVWYTSTGNSPSHVPSATSAAASAIARAMSLGITLSRALTSAAAPLIVASAKISDRSTWSPEIGKFSTARCVCAPHLAVAGTRTSPIESCSTRQPSGACGSGSAMAASLPAAAGHRYPRRLARESFHETGNRVTAPRSGIAPPPTGSRPGIR